jgi:pilus assembly protein CpaB
MSRSTVKAGAARAGALGFLAVALGCAALAAFALAGTMKSRYSGARVEPVVVARAELRAGQPLTAELFEVRDWPADALPDGTFSSVEALMAAYAGATPTVGILAGEPLVAGRLSSARSGTGVAALLRPSMRAIAVEVDDAAGYTGLLYPGAIVDVVATVRDPMGRGPSSRIAVQHARVLSVGLDTDVANRRVQRDGSGLDGAADKGTYVTLEVAPAEAEILAVERAEGRIDLVLRNAADDAVIDTAGATPEQFSAFATPEVAVLADDAAAAPRGREARVPTVKRDKRRIQISASDAPDAAHTTAAASGGAIEVLHAK